MRQRHVATSWSCKTGSHVLRGELRRRPARGETHVLTFSLEGLAYHTDAWVVRLCFRVLGGLPYETDRYIGLFAWVFTLLEYVNLVV